ncbi:MAG TPA: hypothetical protein VN950_19035 [Terriglobales bacterium]|nr:hypothetical protein [Terriglobales bacterium]
MPRKRIYKSDAERQKAYRRRVSADVHNLRGLMKKIIRLQDAMTPESYEKLQELNRKMDRILSK